MLASCLLFMQRRVTIGFVDVGNNLSEVFGREDIIDINSSETRYIPALFPFSGSLMEMVLILSFWVGDIFDVSIRF